MEVMLNNGQGCLMTTPPGRELTMADLVPVWSEVQREPVVDSDLLPWGDPPGSSEGADETKPGTWLYV